MNPYVDAGYTIVLAVLAGYAAFAVVQRRRTERPFRSKGRWR